MSILAQQSTQGQLVPFELTFDDDDEGDKDSNASRSDEHDKSENHNGNVSHEDTGFEIDHQFEDILAFYDAPDAGTDAMKAKMKCECIKVMQAKKKRESSGAMTAENSRKFRANIAMNPNHLNCTIRSISKADQLNIRTNAMAMAKGTSKIKQYFMNNMQTKSSELKFSMDDKFFNGIPYEPIEFNSNDDYYSSDTEYVNLPVKLITRRLTLRTKLCGYVLSERPLSSSTSSRSRRRPSSCKSDSLSPPAKQKKVTTLTADDTDTDTDTESNYVPMIILEKQTVAPRNLGQTKKNGPMPIVERRQTIAASKLDSTQMELPRGARNRTQTKIFGTVDPGEFYYWYWYWTNFISMIIKRYSLYTTSRSQIDT